METPTSYHRPFLDRASLLAIAIRPYWFNPTSFLQHRGQAAPDIAWTLGREQATKVTALASAAHS